MRKDVYNFSAGPAVLPESVLRQAQESIWNYDDSGIGIMEHSHRGPEFSALLEEAVANCRKIANLSDDYEVLFLQGGASTQFFMVPMNWMHVKGSAEYTNTGVWSKKAIAEAKGFGEVRILADGSDSAFSEIPEAKTSSADSSYLHYTSNNTIAGTQYTSPPKVASGVPLLCDASSDIFSGPFDFSKHAMVYAGAQKNLGPSGVALVIVRKDLIEKGAQELPSMLQYRTHSKAKSAFNTPPTFGIFMMAKVFEWILEQGGVSAIAETNTKKAAILYDYLDRSDLFSGSASLKCRSKMNVSFVSKSAELDAKFLVESKSAGLLGLKGHRSVGGMRASIYNAFPTTGVQALVDFMAEFESKNKP